MKFAELVVGDTIAWNFQDATSAIYTVIASRKTNDYLHTTHLRLLDLCNAKVLTEIVGDDLTLEGYEVFLAGRS